MQNVTPRYVQAGEIWTFIHTKEKRVRPDDPPEFGDAYVWFGLDSETKAVLSYYVGKRDGLSAYEFLEDLSRRVTALQMQLRRFIRLTHGFSKKLANLKAMGAVFLVWYNFCRVHQTLRVTSVMEAGWTDYVWTIGNY